MTYAFSAHVGLSVRKYASACRIRSCVSHALVRMACVRAYGIRLCVQHAFVRIFHVPRGPHDHNVLAGEVGAEHTRRVLQIPSQVVPVVAMRLHYLRVVLLR